MKDFQDWGLKNRRYSNKNYNAIWYNLKTVRIGEGVAQELDPDKAEFYDIGITTRCNAQCPFCYVNAAKTGIDFEDICNTWRKWMANYFEYKQKTADEVVTYTDKPFQIAIGSTGEPTVHPDFVKFLKTVFDTHVVPNYTTNGIILAHYVLDKDQFPKENAAEYKKQKALAKKILNATSKYVGGVAVSYGNKTLRTYAKAAIDALMKYGDTNINIHHLISTNDDVDEFIELAKEYGDNIKYHVLLPLMAHGRSKHGIGDGVFDYLEEQILKNDIKNIAFGANFYPYLNKSKIKTWDYPPESLSKNVLLKKGRVEITPSSFNLNPIKIIELQ